MRATFFPRTILVILVLRRYADKFLDFTERCQFGDDALALMRVVNELCEVVHEEGKLCTTPLAGTTPPARYVCGGQSFPGCVGYGVHGWIQLLEEGTYSSLFK